MTARILRVLLALVPVAAAADIGRSADRLVFSIHVDIASELDLDELRDHLQTIHTSFDSSRGAADVPCCTEIEAIDLVVFGSPGDGLDVIDSEAKWIQLGSRKAFVSDITWCGSPGLVFGCATLGGDTLAVSLMSVIPYTIAHERLHNAGIQHGTGTPCTFMDHGGACFTTQECNAFRSLGVADGACACMGPSVGDPAEPNGTACVQDGIPGTCDWNGLCIDVAEGSFDDPFSLNTTAGSDAGDDFLPSVTTDEQGVWVTAWQSDDAVGALGTDHDILVSRSLDGGQTWAPPAPLNTNASSDSGGDGLPHLATDGNGVWLAVWYSEAPVGGIGTDFDILWARSTNGGATWTAPSALNTNASGDTGRDFSPRVATDAQGTWVVVWYSDDALGGTIDTDFDILVSRSTNGGISWTPPAPLNANAGSDSGDDWSPRVETDRQGNWVVAWTTDDTLGGSLGSDVDKLVARSTNGGLTWSSAAPLNTNATSDSGDDGTASLTTDRQGTWVAIWPSSDTLGGSIGADFDILTSRSTNDGLTWSPPVALNTNAAGDSYADGVGLVRTDRQGTWLAVWQSWETLSGTTGTDRDILMATSTDAGITWSPPLPLNNNAVADDRFDGYPALAVDGQGQWLAVWHTGDPFGDYLGGPTGLDGDIAVALPEAGRALQQISGIALLLLLGRWRRCRGGATPTEASGRQQPSGSQTS